MQRRGLISATADSGDRRRSRIAVNDAGRRVLARREQQLSDHPAAAVTASFNAEELECLRAAAVLLDRLADLIGHQRPDL